MHELRKRLRAHVGKEGGGEREKSEEEKEEEKRTPVGLRNIHTRVVRLYVKPQNFPQFQPPPTFFSLFPRSQPACSSQ